MRLRISGLAVSIVHNIRCSHVSKPIQHLHRDFWSTEMKDFLLTSHAQAVIWSTVLLIVIVTAAFVVGRLRDRMDDDRLEANDLLTNFRDLHLQGDIEDSEFRDIKSVLGTKLKRELSDKDQRG